MTRCHPTNSTRGESESVKRKSPGSSDFLQQRGILNAWIPSSTSLTLVVDDAWLIGIRAVVYEVGPFLTMHFTAWIVINMINDSYCLEGHRYWLVLSTREQHCIKSKSYRAAIEILLGLNYSMFISIFRTITISSQTTFLGLPIFWWFFFFWGGGEQISIVP